MMCRVRIGIICALFKGRYITVFSAFTVYRVPAGGACCAATGSGCLLSGRTLCCALRLCVRTLRAGVLCVCALRTGRVSICTGGGTRAACRILCAGGSTCKLGVACGSKLRLRLMCRELRLCLLRVEAVFMRCRGLSRASDNVRSSRTLRGIGVCAVLRVCRRCGLFRTLRCRLSCCIAATLRFA